MKTLLKILIIAVILSPVALFLHYRNSDYSIQKFSPDAAAKINFTIIKNIIAEINGVKTAGDGIIIKKLDKNVDNPFSKFIVQLKDYEIDTFRISGVLEFEFNGFNDKNNPYYALTCKNVIVHTHDGRYVVNGSQIITFVNGFYSFSELDDDILQISGDFKIKHSGRVITMVNKDVMLDSYSPVSGFLTVTSNLDEKILSFSRKNSACSNVLAK